MFDSTRETTQVLAANSSKAESGRNNITFDTLGFSINTSAAESNQRGQTYIYLAIA